MPLDETLFYHSLDETTVVQTHLSRWIQIELGANMCRGEGQYSTAIIGCQKPENWPFQRISHFLWQRKAGHGSYPAFLFFLFASSH
jgi:hypothetical protein